MSGHPGDRVDGATRTAIEAVLIEWAWLIDHGRATEAAVLFTADAEQSIAGVVASGNAAISAGLQRRAALTQRTSRHVVSNIRLDLAANGDIAVSSILTLYRSDDAAWPARPIMVADVADTFRRTDDGWRIHTRTVSPVFAD
ncbi:nuclear transport factor 2 family protein [Bradyrhizobium sp. U87765 SZCCT0131]|uniref:nuclear transport factor 2 family protein n=1 Tax=unclassified Bradyrhizobium TaxID=2631580 RepID=UPI001BA56330|nr:MULTISPECIES: nuclear transport factor 2 family protein [unclassified Bradyrhizobium]MBR1217699.1 nuclear transport factor 2 family protein [Bradyrhizobium sp. U87765 SZCCT0131]MBR1261355.1 nuclear transport factor 2 family protein [Bradyrhizobium sp. U87765 SZCCT0134]MBR1303197.1 nuclear transport factor 2 family protein [Bradyrhizobium sp. U87765 SZCCT0110]MBR1318803.1 nuclear transport factor 2 family protein [Bradyrhizobium sp. U87765 SZCCT0109]MBR1347128.1 nuclear transport factor 2 fa